MNSPRQQRNNWTAWLRPLFPDAELQQLAPNIPAQRVHLLLNGDEMLRLELAIEGDLDRHWEPDEKLHRCYLNTVTEVRDNLYSQAAADWSEDCKRFATRLEEDGVRLSEGIAIVREWTSHLRALLRAMGAVDLLPAPEGRSPTPTHPMPTPMAAIDPPIRQSLIKQEGNPTPPPTQPTRESCLLPPNIVRWQGEQVEVQQRLWRLLGVLLDKGNRVSAEDIEETLWPGKERRGKRLANDVSALNLALESIKWPHTYSTKGGYVLTERLIPS